MSRELAEATGEMLADAVLNALQRIARQRQKRPAPRKASEILNDARLRLAKLPVLDNRSDDEILGYDEDGLPH